MSHFTVAVVVPEPSKAAITKALQPFHEYECTGIEDEHVVWVDEHDRLLQEYEAEADEVKQEYPRFDLYVIGYHGYTNSNLQNGRWGRKTNPNAKWDWWVIGGRWSDHWLVKGSDTPLDVARKGDIDTERMIARQREKMLGLLKTYHELAAGRDFLSWTEVRKQLSDDTQAARAAYRAQPGINELNQGMGTFDCAVDYFKHGNEAEYMKDLEYQALGTYAVLKDGIWHTKGRMLYFGISVEESDTWPQQWKELFNSVPDDHYIAVVDCHI
jgi:hypothetical protein